MFNVMVNAITDSIIYARLIDTTFHIIIGAVIRIIIIININISKYYAIIVCVPFQESGANSRISKI